MTAFSPTLVLDVGRILYIGLVEDVAEHKAMVPVFGAGVDGDFELSFGARRCLQRTGVVRSKVPHGVRAFGRRLAVMPIDPSACISALDSTGEDEVFDIPRPGAALDALRSLAEGYSDAAWLALGTAVGMSAAIGDYPEPLSAAMRLIDQDADENLPAEKLAAEVGLSVSRLQHLFQARAGATLRSYRMWRRFRAVMGAVQRGRTLTEAAHEAGFFDAAHFSSAFKRTFGVTPSFVFSEDLRVHVVDRAAS